MICQKSIQQSNSLHGIVLIVSQLVFTIGSEGILKVHTMELLEPIVVSDHAFSVTGPTLLDSYKSGKLLYSYLALWHPLILVQSACLPRIVPLKELGGRGTGILALVLEEGDAEQLQMNSPFSSPPENAIFLATETVEEGCKLILNSEVLKARNGDFPHVGKDAIGSDPVEAWSVFRGLGLGLAWIDSLYDAQNHTNLLERDIFFTCIQKAASDWIGGCRDACNKNLTDAAQTLLGAREQLISGTPRILETVCWDHRVSEGLKLSFSMPRCLSRGFPSGILISGATIEHIENYCPLILEELICAQTEGLLEICGGKLLTRLEASRPLTSQIWNLKAGQKVFKRVFGECCRIAVQDSLDLHPALPALWKLSGISHAILNSTKSGIQKARAAVVSWSWGDGMGVETLARIPLNTNCSSTGLDLSYWFQQSHSIDYSPLIYLQEKNEHGSMWHDDFLTLCRLTPLLGEYGLPGDILRAISPADYWTMATANESIPKHQEGIDWAHFEAELKWRNKMQVLKAAWSFTSILASLSGPLSAQNYPSEQDPWRSLAADLSKIEDDYEKNNNSFCQESVSAIFNESANKLAARIVSRGLPDTPGWLILNPCLFARRGVIRIPGESEYVCKDAIRACQVEPDGNISLVVEVPPCGFVWLPKQGDKTQGVRGKLRLADERGLRNEFFEVEIDPSTGGMRVLRDIRQRKQRLAAQLVLPGGSAMVAKGIRVLSEGPGRGEVESVGELVDNQGVKAAEFRMILKAWLGRPVLEMEIQVELSVHERPNSNGGILRLAWRDPAIEIKRAWMGAGIRLDNHSGDQSNCDWVEFTEGKATTTVFPLDFPLARRHGNRMLDFPLGAGSIPLHGTHRIFFALDRDFPFLLAQSLQFPLPILDVARGAPPSGSSGWLAKMDRSEAILLDVRPGVLSGQDALLWTIVSSGDQGMELALDLAKRPNWGKVTDLLGQEQRSGQIGKNGMEFLIQRMEWVVAGTAL